MLSKSKASYPFPHLLELSTIPPFSLKASITLWLYANFYRAFHYKPTYTGTESKILYLGF